MFSYFPFKSSPLEKAVAVAPESPDKLAHRATNFGHLHQNYLILSQKAPTWKCQSGRVQATILVFIKPCWWECGLRKWWSRWNSTRWLAGHKGKKGRKNDGKNLNCHFDTNGNMRLNFDFWEKPKTTGFSTNKLVFACWLRRQIVFLIRLRV